jgi:hypothetical protein
MERLKLMSNCSLLYDLPVKLLQIYKRRLSLLSIPSLTLVVLQHYLNPVVPLPQNNAVTRTQIFALSDLPVVPASGQTPLPTLHQHLLHLFLEVLPYAPDADIDNLVIGV